MKLKTIALALAISAVSASSALALSAERSWMVGAWQCTVNKKPHAKMSWRYPPAICADNACSGLNTLPVGTWANIGSASDGLVYRSGTDKEFSFHFANNLGQFMKMHKLPGATRRMMGHLPQNGGRLICDPLPSTNAVLRGAAARP
jgi:hypothetical protein